MVLKIDTKLEGKRTCAFKNDMKNLSDLCSLAKKQGFHFRKLNGRTKLK